MDQLMETNGFQEGVVPESCWRRGLKRKETAVTCNADDQKNPFKKKVAMTNGQLTSEQYLAENKKFRGRQYY